MQLEALGGDMINSFGCCDCIVGGNSLPALKEWFIQLEALGDAVVYSFDCNCGE